MKVCASPQHKQLPLWRARRRFHPMLTRTGSMRVSLNKGLAAPEEESYYGSKRWIRGLVSYHWEGFGRWRAAYVVLGVITRRHAHMRVSVRSFPPPARRVDDANAAGNTVTKFIDIIREVEEMIPTIWMYAETATWSVATGVISTTSRSNPGFVALRGTRVIGVDRHVRTGEAVDFALPAAAACGRGGESGFTLPTQAAEQAWTQVQPRHAE